jgi:hypothetical protein
LPAGLSAWVVGRIADNSTLTDGLATLLFVPLFGLGAAAVFFLIRRRSNRRRLLSELPEGSG